MNILTRYLRKRAINKFIKRDLRIIQDIPAEQLVSLIDTQQKEGWEVRSVHPVNAIGHIKWQGKLCKGASAITCRWDTQNQGSMVGIARIVKPLGEAYGLQVDTQPRYD